ncbi:hypothetical protein Tco_0083187, partial [Tanacetum coccineum]
GTDHYKAACPRLNRVQEQEGNHRIKLFCKWKSIRDGRRGSSPRLEHCDGYVLYKQQVCYNAKVFFGAKEFFVNKKQEDFNKIERKFSDVDAMRSLKHEDGHIRKRKEKEQSVTNVVEINQEGMVVVSMKLCHIHLKSFSSEVLQRTYKLCRSFAEHVSSQRMVEGVCDAPELVPILEGTKGDTDAGTELIMNIFNSDNSFEYSYGGGKLGTDGNRTGLKGTFLGYAIGVGAKLYIHN